MWLNRGNSIYFYEQQIIKVWFWWKFWHYKDLSTKIDRNIKLNVQEKDILKVLNICHKVNK